LLEQKTKLKEELELLDELVKEHLKSYQVWSVHAISSWSMHRLTEFRGSKATPKNDRHRT